MQNLWNLSRYLKNELKLSASVWTRISWNLTEYQLIHLSIGWLNWNFGGFTKFFFKQMIKVSAFYLEKRKSFIPKKIFFKPLSISKQKIFVKWPKIPGCFWSRVQTSWSLCLHRSILLKNALDCSRLLEQAYCYYTSTKSWHISESTFLLFFTFIFENSFKAVYE